MTIEISEVDRVEILTLQDNYVDLISRDNSDVVQRAMPKEDMGVPSSILAEHGFSTIVTVTKGNSIRSVLFDFGFSPHGAAINAEALGVDLSIIEAVVLSHGHMDHVGGLAELIRKMGMEGIELVLHPAAFRSPRYLKIADDVTIDIPPFTREKVLDIGLTLIETKRPKRLIDGNLLFLGEIPRVTDFEKGLSIAYYQKRGEERWDDIADDSAILANVRGKGLVVLSGCGHSGIINTILYSKEISGVDRVFAVMGGFHLTGPEMVSAIDPTVQRLKEINPTYIIPTHCTGRDAVLRIEREMPDKFLLNMSGTKLIFKA
ncbi:MAG: MBL fold metallo-hydrolase [Thermodesulfobacteriota bacterium]|nr:MBL fold metallo-hydrolase [Thermodesulfobacteriota bacterium]